jgi:hypothetical protein
MRASSAPTPTGRTSYAAGGVVVGLQPHDHPRTLGQWRLHVVEQPSLAGDLQRHLGRGVAQDEEAPGRLAAAVELRHLAFDPDAAEPADPVGERERHATDRKR